MIRVRTQPSFAIVAVWFVVALSLGCDSTEPEGLMPDSPVIVAPDDGAPDQSNAVMLEWGPVVGAETYHVQVARDAAFSVLIADRTALTATRFMVKDLEIGVAYYWRVRASNMAGFSNWSPARSIRPVKMIEAPDVPALIYPPDGSESLPTTVDLAWASAEGAFTYHIQVSVEPTFLRNEADMEVYGTVQTVRSLVATYTYYWRVRAHNAAGYGAWSPIQHFIVAE